MSLSSILSTLSLLYILETVPSTVNGAAFELGIGSNYCELTDDGNCFQSLNYPIEYQTLETCSFKATHPLKLQVVGFDVEEDDETCSSEYDYVTVRGHKYCGTSGPNNISVGPDDIISWNADEQYGAAGFRICHTASAPSCTKRTGTVNNLQDCWCGEYLTGMECTSTTGRFCLSAIKKCSKIPAQVCSLRKAELPNEESCACGTSTCDATTGLFCMLNENTCSRFKPCADKDGQHENINSCTCEITDCNSTTGRFCLAEKGVGQCSKQRSFFLALNDTTINEAVKNFTNSTFKRSAIVSIFGPMREWDVSRVTSFKKLF